MDQENSLDFQALRAKFQEEDIHYKQPKIKPALPEKPKVVPPPSSPTHYLPAGARPSLLTSISQSLEGKSQVAPRVVFKDDKKESKKPLLLNHGKGKEKSEKVKKGKDKATKGSKEHLDQDLPQDKPKKEGKEKRISIFPLTPKENTTELVPVAPPPKNTVTKKKGFLGFRKSMKKETVEVPSDPILDIPSTEVPGPVPLIPVPSDFDDTLPEPETSPLRALLPNIPTLPDPGTAVEVTPSSITPDSPDLTQPPALIPAVPQSETSFQVETPALNISRPVSQNDLSPPSAIPTPPPGQAAPPVISTPSPTPPEPVAVAEPDIEAMIRAAVEKPPTPVIEPPSKTPSPKLERPVSALSALERAEELSPAKKTVPCDQRIFNALQKARKKTPSSMSNPTSTYSITPPPEEYPPPQSPTNSFPELPPIDYEAGKMPLVNGLDHRQASPVLEGITEEGTDPTPEVVVAPPLPPKKSLPDPLALGPAPQKPDRPSSVNLTPFMPPPPIEDIPAPLDFSETDTTDVPEFEDVTSDANSPELQVSEWGNGDYTSPESPDGHNLSEPYSNGLPSPAAEVHAAPTYGDNPLTETITIPISQEAPPAEGVPVVIGNGIYESSENVYEDIGASATKKRGKTEGKKRKGPPKNPYAEAAQETSEEKSKTGRFCKNEKKASTEGPDEKELKKKEKQRQEKERKEQKEKQEREKKEQKEREKKENEMKKKFKITGQEDAMYEATVTVTTKGRKNDLPVTSGDVISVIRTTNCPKGKWLARDSSNNYGYVAVDHVRLDIQEMLNMGKKAAISRKTNINNNNVVEPEAPRAESRSSNHYPLSAESFTDDSEEWTGDDDELMTPPPNVTDPLASLGHTRTLSMPDMGNKELNVNHQHSHSDINPDGTHDQARHEALQKLATFFHSPKPVEPAARPEADSDQTQEPGFDPTFILPPPELYADLTVE
ncbi:FYN-binding protein 1-like [Xyrichtys novacula]|uniref:FYN-binding protein 1-like n=1 Tax=Xyrichtys novacula TaxID=13765 RepID=A0AAV1FGH4_XYRNO|nr:FYN-binding protein 1-like [Xyrichtys novacula]